MSLSLRAELLLFPGVNEIDSAPGHTNQGLGDADVGEEGKAEAAAVVMRGRRRSCARIGRL